MKKKLLFSIVLLIGSLLAGCIGPAAPGSKPTPTAVAGTATEIAPTPTPTIKVDPANLKGVDIVFMYPWTGEVQIAVEKMVAEFNANNEWGIRVTTSAPGSSSALSEAVSLSLQNFAPPEVIAAPIDYLLRLNQTEKIVTDLTPYASSPEWGLTADDISYFSRIIWQQDVVNGIRYGIPAQRTAKVLVYNKTWADELGFTELPTTPQIFEQQICDVSGKMKLDGTTANDGMGGWLIDYDGLSVASWLTAFGSDYGKSKSIVFNNSSTISALQFLRGLQDNDCAWLGSKTAPYEYFAKRQTLVYIADLEEMFQQTNAQKLAESTDEWMALPFPSKDGSFILAQGPSYAVLATSETRKLAAWLFVRWMSNVDHQGKIVKASGSLPLGQKSIQYAIELEDSLPQWAQVAAMIDLVKVPPSIAGWHNAEMIMEDASWQLFRTEYPVEEIPDLVKLMDQTYSEMSVDTP